MSTFLLVIVHLLANMGVPMMRQVEEHYAPVPTQPERAHPSAYNTPSQARSVPTSEWELRAKKIEQPKEISNGF